MKIALQYREQARRAYLGVCFRSQKGNSGKMEHLEGFGWALRLMVR